VAERPLVLPPDNSEPAMDPSGNLFLRMLVQAGANLQPHLSHIALNHGAILYEAGGLIDRVYFPTAGLVSLVVPLVEGDAVETAMAGLDGVVGASSAIDGQRSVSRAVVQIAGAALAVGSELLRQVAHENNNVHSAIAAHEEVRLAQSQQCAACNASHSVSERLAKWLLLARDRTGSDELLVTQEFLAQMLAVRRSTVSLEAHALQGTGCLRYRRGHVHILSVEGLQEIACECYGAISSRFARLYGPPENW
jgi:CRP-like cAMP-binding protein